MTYRFNDSEKFRANAYLVAGFGFFAPVGIALNDYFVNSILPSTTEWAILALSFVIGFLTVVRAYSIMYEKDLKDV